MKQKVSTKSFRAFYEREKQKPTPAEKFIENMANLTQKSTLTVRGWLFSGKTPDKLTKKILAEKLKVNEEDLFPQITENDN